MIAKKFRCLFVFLFFFSPSLLLATTVLRGPYLQLEAVGAVTIRWITSDPTDSRVYYSQSPTTQDQTADDATVTTDHAVRLLNLNTNEQYYYRVGSTSGPLSDRYNFTTSPDDMHPLYTRFWFLGDPGADPTEAALVRDGYNLFRGTATTNLMFLLGGMAYNNGADSDFQSRLFDVFWTELGMSGSVATLGEQETGGSSNPSSAIPYFSIFDLYANKESGGVESGSEKYYSFDFGTIHFVCLDSEASDRSPTGPMLTWLRSDLAANLRPWLIAYWHHSPYSKGDHDSDDELEMSEMRANANQILEDHGVDLVVTAHSHDYERSFLIDGHYGNSGSFKQSMVKDDGDGRIDGAGPYTKPGNTTHTGAVYVVAGSSSEAIPGTLNHPAMYKSLAETGSLAVDVNCAQLNASFIDNTGAVLDYFTINKMHATPTVTMLTPTNGEVYAAPANIWFRATATSPNSHIRRLRFLYGDTRIGTDYVAPYQALWSNVKAGTYTVTVQVHDELCGIQTSAPVNITVASCSGPAIPNLVSPADGQANVLTSPLLDWSDVTSTGYDVELCSDSTCGDVIAQATNIQSSQWQVDQELPTGTQFYWHVRARNACGIGSFGPIRSFTTAGPPCLFCDDFDDSILSNQWTYEIGAWSESAGALHGSNGTKKSKAFAMPAFNGCDTCTVSSEITTTGDAYGRAGQVSLIGWYQNKANYVELLIKQSKGKVILKQRVSGNIVSKDSAKIALAANTPIQAKVSFDGAAFTVYINGSSLLTVPVAPGSTPSGTVGFQVKATDASFGDVLVN